MIVLLLMLTLYDYLIISTFATASGNDAQLPKLQTYVDVEKLENELVLTTAEYLLSLANVKWTYTGNLYF